MSRSGLEHRGEHDPRAAALLVVQEVLSSQKDSQLALDRRLKNSRLIPTDKKLCTELTYGTLRRHLRLEWFLRRKLSKPDKLPPEMLLALELALYQLGHTRIPAHAAIDWTVGLVKNRFGAGLSRVANGVLRPIARELDQEYSNPRYYADSCGKGLDSPDVLSIYHAMPEWIVQLWIDGYGLQRSLELLAMTDDPAPLGLRVNRTKGTAASVLKKELLERKDARAVGPDAVLLPEGAGKNVRVLEEGGEASRQSMGAYEALWAMNPQEWKGPVWDCCAGRGGKTAALLEQGIAVELASDNNAQRINSLLPELERLGLAQNAPRILHSEVQSAGIRNQFSTILLDVPCSGLGTLSHRPEIRWRRSLEDLKKLSELQDSILDSALLGLKNEGQIVYITCTANPAENQERVRAFMKRHPEVETKISQEFESSTENGYGEFFYAASIMVATK